MSFSKFNGWDPGLREGSVRGKRPPLGELDPAWTNRPQAYRRGRLEEWSGKTPILEPGCADTLEAMLDGRGHHIPLNGDLYSTAGLVPQGGAGTFTFPGYVAERPVHGRTHLSLTVGTIIWNPGFHDGKWTVMYWRQADLGFGFGLAEHIAVRSDGAKWLDGVRADATTTTELVVSNGAASFGVEEYDDIVLLPYAACDEKIEAFYLWTTAHRMTVYIPMSSLAREFESNTPAVVTGTVAFVDGQVSLAADFQDAAARLAYGSSVNFDIASVGDDLGFAVEVWVNPDTLAATAVVVDHRDAGDGWTLQITSAGQVLFFATRAVTDTEALAPVGVASTGEWTHVAVSMDPSTLRATIYINGVAVALATDIAGDGALDSDTGATLFVGNNVGSVNAIDGRVNEVRIMQRAATSAEIEERWLLGFEGVAPPTRQPYSDLPYLDMHGDIVGGKTVEIKGQVQQQDVVQHGSAAGWVANAREVAATMRLRRPRSQRRLSAPDVGWILDDRYLSGVTLRPAYGPFTGTLENGVTADGREGPLGHGQSFNFDDTSDQRILLSTGERDAITGARALTVAAWIRRVASNDQDVILSYGLSGPVSMLQFDITGAAGGLRIGGRSRAGETFRSITAASAVDDEWRHVAGVMDLAGDELVLFVDGEVVLSGAVTWDQPRLSGETPADSYVGAHPVGNLAFDGDIASVGVWYRRLGDADIRNHYLAGLKGDFR